MRLKERFELRGWKKLPYALVDRRALSPKFLRQEEMDALRLCNGRVDLDMGIIPAVTREQALRFERLGVVERCEPGTVLAPGQEYRLYPSRYIRNGALVGDGPVQLPLPALLHVRAGCQTGRA